MRAIALMLIVCGLSGCVSKPVKEYITWKGCVPGEETTFVACDQLHAVAGWEGCGNPTRSATCFYNPPPGYVLLDTSTRFNSGPAGRTSYSPGTFAAGAKILSRSEIESKYNSAIDLAAKYLDFEASGKLKEEKNDTLRLYDEIDTNRNLFRAIVTAKGDGFCPGNAKRSWINVTVVARAVCLGTPESLNAGIVKGVGDMISCCAPGNASCIEGSCKVGEVASCDLDSEMKPVIKCTADGR